MKNDRSGCVRRMEVWEIRFRFERWVHPGCPFGGSQEIQEKGVWKIDGYSRADRVTLAPFQKSVGSSGYSIQERRVNSLPFNGIDYVWEPVKNYRIQGEEKYSRFMSRRGRGGELGNLFRFTTVKLDRLDDRRFVVFGEAMLGDGERVNVTLPLEVYEATLESVKKRLSEGTGVPGSE